MTAISPEIWKKRDIWKNKKAVEEYVRNRLGEDIISVQITIKEYKDPFKGGEE